MRPFSSVSGWLPLVLLTAGAASYTREHQAGAVCPALEQLLNRGNIQDTQEHLQDLGFDLGPENGIYTTQTQAAVRVYQARYGLSVLGILDYATRRELLPGLDFQEPNP